jgi:cytochrome c553
MQQKRRKRTMLVRDGWMDKCTDEDLHPLSDTYSQEKKKQREEQNACQNHKQ